MNPKPTASNRFSKLRGFTLMELLIVIVIIVILVAIGVPVTRKMRDNADRNQCINRLHSWAIAIGGYAADHDGKVAWKNWAPIGWDEASCSPYVHYWTGGSVTFTDKEDNNAFKTQLTMRHCPSVGIDKTGESNPSPTYAMIRPTSGTALVPNGEYPIVLVKNPARFIMMIEALPNTGAPITGSGDFTTKVKPLTQNGPNLRHNHTVNSLFADYSVKPMAWKDIEKGLNYWSVF